MKRFHELTDSQKKEAVLYALRKLKEAVSDGFIVFSNNPTDATLIECAKAAAEDAWYSEENQVIADIT